MRGHSSIIALLYAVIISSLVTLGVLTIGYHTPTIENVKPGPSEPYLFIFDPLMVAISLTLAALVAGVIGAFARYNQEET